MKRFGILCAAALLLAFSVPPVSAAPEPDGRRRYNEVAWLTTHNAFANHGDGWLYA